MPRTSFHSVCDNDTENRLLSTPLFHTATRYPDQLAVVENTRSITYQQLAEDVRVAARRLAQGGVRTGDRIGILLERSIDAIVAIYATLTLGAVYVPFDSRWPVLRRRQVLEAIDAKAIVASNPDGTTAGLAPLILTPSEFYVSDAELREPSNELAVDPKNLAYILFTSGTTGVPKGVCVSHCAARHFVEWTKHEFGLTCRDRVAGVSSFTFDLSIFDVFSTLSSGATLYLYDHRKVILSSNLARFLERHSVTIIYTVPTTLSLLEARGRLNRYDLSSLRVVMFAGEQYPSQAFHRLRAALPSHVKYSNLYGPTETNVCTAYHVDGDISETAGIPIGRPLPGFEIIPAPVADQSLHGANAAELYVTGPSLMTGYWGQSNEEAAHWWYDPASGRRAYRTGDICRLDENNNWIFLGRVDNQVKVNGFRIEVEEVENVLLTVPAVAHCAVVAVRTSGNSIAQLVAYVVLGDDVEAEELSTRLTDICRTRLPSYSQPQKYVYVLQIPTTVSGKVDRAALVEHYTKHRTSNIVQLATFERVDAGS